MSKGESVEIVVKGTDHVVGYACAECQVFHAALMQLEYEQAKAGAKERADDCCMPQKCLDCGGRTLARFRLYCQSCELKREAARDHGAFDKAEKVPAENYSGWACWPYHGPRDGHFASVEDLEEYCADHELAMPTYVWACTELRGFGMDADYLVEDALQEHHEDAKDNISAEEIARLQTFLDEWCAAQTVVSYQEDRTRAVVLRSES